ncbi:MAG: Tol-Pal system beta propeller repeat protein TolB [Zoogloeaceae bacterium]|jgi:TolB protein|nr:Tol-Pal system beta propeller repeat protein TolB [Zoogloeaceae bacterium]
MTSFFRSLAVAAVLTVGAASAQAQLSIEITGAGASRIPLSIANFAGDPNGQVTSVVKSDLANSGLFALVDSGGEVVAENAPVDFARWKLAGADALATGSLAQAAGGRLETRYRLYDIARSLDLGGAVYLVPSTRLRAAAHRVADDIYLKLTGQPGIFSTRIAYVQKGGGRYLLQIADADGQNAQTALVSREPIISPAWSPDGSKLAYVSFENKKPIIYVHSLASGRRQVVANFKGSNSAPAWSPDGNTLAVVLTREGHSQIYTIPATGGAPTKLTSSSGIDTEPAYGADGYVYFTSDRGGQPQIYRVSATGGTAERMTYEGNYNVSPAPSPDGKSLAFITRRDGKFQLASMDLASRQVQVLSDSGRDESPAFSPNSRMIVFATEVGGRGILTATSADGRIRLRLSVTSGDIREPAWGPLVK